MVELITASRRRQINNFADRFHSWVIPYKNYLTAHNRALPDFIVIGAQKSYTTSMYRYLGQHPNIVMSERKEVRFFDLYYGKGIRWYRANFPTRAELGNSQAITGEITPTYIDHPKLAERIKDTLPDVKLILMMRDPVTRAYSQYWHLVSRKVETRPFWEAIEHSEAIQKTARREIWNCRGQIPRPFLYFSYLHRGYYFQRIQDYLEYFPRSRMHFIVSEDMKRDGKAVMDDLCRFLGVESYAGFDLSRKYHVSKRPKLSDEDRERLRQYYVEDNKKLAEFLGREIEW